MALIKLFIDDSKAKTTLSSDAIIDWNLHVNAWILKNLYWTFCIEITNLEHALDKASLIQEINQLLWFPTINKRK